MLVAMHESGYWWADGMTNVHTLSFHFLCTYSSLQVTGIAVLAGVSKFYFPWSRKCSAKTVSGMRKNLLPYAHVLAAGMFLVHTTPQLDNAVIFILCTVLQQTVYCTTTGSS